MKKRVLIVGGVAGGATAAARLRRLDEELEIIMFEKGEHVSFANCGLPYYIGDVISKRESLLVQTPEGLKKRYNLDVRTLSEVTKINTKEKKVEIKDISNNKIYSESYDYLILSPGAEPIKPPISGLETANNVFTLRNLKDTDRIKEHVTKNQLKEAVIIGGGFIGVEMAENLHNLGLKVNIVEMGNQVLSPLDYEMACIVHNHLIEKGINLVLEDGVKSFQENGKYVELQSGKKLNSDITILAIGVKPESKLALDAGLKLNEKGGIIVNEYLETSVKDIYAIGDAIQVNDYILGEPTQVPLAWPANRQGRMVADNICGKQEKYKGTLGTAIVKVFDLTIAVTGTNEKKLQKSGREYLQVHIHPGSHAGYYPGSSAISLKLTFNNEGKIFGAQGVGRDGVDKRIDVIATAIKGHLKVKDLQDLELAYAPMYSSAKDPVNMLGYTAQSIIDNDVKTIQWNEIEKLDANKYQILDVREAGEFELGNIKGAINNPLSNLREEITNGSFKIDKEKTLVVYCQVGLRGYVISRFLKQHGFKVLNLDGGYKTYSNVFVPSKSKVEAEDTGISKELNITLSNQNMNENQFIDASGLQCPGPLQMIYEAMKNLQDGQILKVVATDPAFHIDIEKWCERTGNTLLKKYQEGSQYFVVIQKMGGQAEGIRVKHFGDNKLTMIVFDGDLDKAIASFIIANGAAAFGKEVVMFFTFWGLNILRKPEGAKVKKNLIEKMFGMMMPRGASKLGLSKMQMFGMGPLMIKYIMKSKNVKSIEELMSDAQKNGVRLVACTMSMDVMGIKKEEFIDGVELGGVASYLGEADSANVNMFI